MKKLLPILILSFVTLLSCEQENIVVNDEIRNFIEQRYEGARILYAEQEFNEIDVEIVHDNIRKEVKFNRNNNWINTVWDVYVSQLPEIVTASVANEYAGYRIDDADYVETPSGDHYKLEIEKGEWERTVFVTPDGEILN